MRKPADAAAKKLRSQGGLTLVELLVTVILVTLAGGIITATVDMSTKQFRSQAQSADAQLLCSALSLFVQNELTYAGNIENGSPMTFTDHTRDLGTGCWFGVNEEGRLILNYSGGNCEAVGKGSYESRFKKLKAEITTTPSYSGDKANKVKVEIKILDGKTDELLTRSSFVVKPIAP